MAKSDEALGWLKFGALAFVALKAADLLGAILPEADPDEPGPQDVPLTCTPSLPSVQLLAMASAIEWAITGVTEDEAEVVRQLKMVRTDCDVQALIDAYGARAPHWGASAVDLPATVSMYLRTGQIDDVNAHNARTNINYRW